MCLCVYKIMYHLSPVLPCVILCQWHCHVIWCRLCCHLTSAALSCIIWCQQCFHVSFDAPQKTKTNLRWGKTVFWQEVSCSHGDQNTDSCWQMLSFYSYPVCLFIRCHFIHVLCVSSDVVILFIFCVSLHHVSFYSYSVCLFIMCHAIHILCVSSYVVIHSYPVCLFIICCHSFISCVALHHMLTFIHILCVSSSYVVIHSYAVCLFVILFMSYVSLHHMCRMLCWLHHFVTLFISDMSLHYIPVIL